MRAGLTEALFPFLSRLAKETRGELGALAIVAGSLRVYYVSAEGCEATLYTVEPGGTCVLALTATMNAEAYPAYVDAGPTGAEFVVVPARLVYTLVDGERAFREFVFGALSGRIFDLMRTLEEVGSDQVQQRVARYLVRCQGPDACVRVSQARIAAELGTAREVIFRALRSLCTRSIVTTGRLCIRIADAERLAQVASSKEPLVLEHHARPDHPDHHRLDRRQPLRGRRRPTRPR
jgi:CRP/FNR family transcriptional regulator